MLKPNGMLMITQTMQLHWKPTIAITLRPYIFDYINRQITVTYGQYLLVYSK